MNSIWLMKLGKKHIEEWTMNRDECRGVPGLQCFPNQAYNCSIWGNISIIHWTINLVLELLCLRDSTCYSIVMFVFRWKSSISLWNFLWQKKKINKWIITMEATLVILSPATLSILRLLLEIIWKFDTGWRYLCNWRKMHACTATYEFINIFSPAIYKIRY